MSFIQQDEGIILNGSGGNLFAARQGMLFGNDQQEFLFEERLDFQVFRNDRHRKNGQINFTVTAPSDQIIRGILLHYHRDIRMPVRKISQ